MRSKLPPPTSGKTFRADLMPAKVARPEPEGGDELDDRSSFIFRASLYGAVEAEKGAGRLRQTARFTSLNVSYSRRPNCGLPYLQCWRVSVPAR
jgi:hypothetical protein